MYVILLIMYLNTLQKYLNTMIKYKLKNVFKYCSALNTLSECISRSSKEKLREFKF